MRDFTDNKARRWEIDITTNAIRMVREKLSVDLCKLHSDEAPRVFGDPVMLIDVLFVLVEKSARQREITDEDFGAGMVGDPIDFGAAALLAAVADFFPQSKRALMQKIASKGQELSELAATRALALLENLTLEKLTKPPTPPPEQTDPPPPPPMVFQP